jgi:hypothetical protein
MSDTKRMIVSSTSRLRLWATTGILASCAASLVGACRPSDDVAPDAGTVQQALGGLPVGGLVGTLRASYQAIGSVTVPVPGVEVWAQNVVTGVQSPHVTTDHNGRYHVSRPPGNYKICWSKPGFTSACTIRIFNVVSAGVGVGIESIAVATQNVLRGNIHLADQSKCLSEDPLFGIKQSAVAEFLDAASAVLHRAEPNTQGEFVLPWAPAARTLRVRCVNAVQTYPAGTTLDGTGGTSFQVTINNHRPLLEPIVATVGGFDARQGVAPGTVVSLTARATDPDGSVPAYHWRAPVNAGVLPDTGAATATWTVPSVPGTYSAYVSADDGRGGFVSRSVDVTVTMSSMVLVSGTVHDRQKNAISSAAISIGGQTTTSNELGNFSLSVPRANAYLLTIEKPGYAELSRRMTRPPRGQEFILSDSHRVAINPAVTNTIVDQRRAWLGGGRQYERIGGRVTLPANSLDLTTPPVGQLYAYITTIDPIGEDMAGDMGAVNASDANVFLVTYGAVFIEIRDEANNEYNLAPGKTATVDIPIQQPILANDRGVTPTMASWTFDIPSGNWVQLPGSSTKVQLPITATQSSTFYRTTVNHFSTKNADLEKVDPACVRVLLNGLPHTMKAFIDVEVAPNAPRRREVPLDDDINTIYNLPANTPYVLQVFDENDVFLNQFQGNTGDPWGGVGIPPANAVCATKSLDAAVLGIPGDPIAQSRFLSFKGGSGDLATTNGYYTGVDPNGLRTNLKAFFLTNGFGADGSGGTRTSFINNNDLGFGRDMYCKQDGLNAACYVSNYGGPDQSPGNFTAAQAASKPDVKKTVAMEYSPIENADPNLRVVKFYIFDGACTDVTPDCMANSPRSPSANLDGAGEKFVPQLCMNCHGGGNYYTPAIPALPTPAEVNVSASFLPFDVYSYRDGTAGPKPSDPAFGLAGILAQEADFFTQNQIVLATNPAAPIQDLLSVLYPSNAPPIDPNALPCGWRSSTEGACNDGFFGGTDNPGTETLYHDVVGPACRTCHVAQRNDIAWDTYGKFGNIGNQSSIAFLVCSQGFMPHASITSLNFWRSNSPHGPDTLKNFSQPVEKNANSPAWVAFGSCSPP